MDEELKKLIEKLTSLETISQEELDLLAKINAQQEANTAAAVKGAPQRKIDFSDDSGRRVRSITEIGGLPQRMLNDEEKELQNFSDDMYILSTILGKNPRNFKAWDGFMTKSSALRKALDTATATEGTEWVPTVLSANWIDKFRLDSKVAALFQDLPMPSNPYDIPFLSGGITFYYVGESTSDSPTASPPSTAATGKQTLTAKKLKARVYFSDELTEDSIVPVLEVLRAEMGKAGAEHLDDVVLNGDTTATHMDSDVTDPKDHRKAWNGLRDLCPAGTKVSLATFNYANHRSIVKAMGKYGLSPTDIAIISGSVGINNYRNLAEVITIDKYGPKAVVLNGELAKLDGMSLVASEKIRENLNASGVYDATTMTKSISVYVNRKGFFLGTRGGVKLTFKEEGETDQNQLIMRFRKAFVNRWTVSSDVTTIGLAYNFA